MPAVTLASCHVCASIPNFLVLEWHWRERPHWNTLLQTTEPIIQNGYTQVPDTPGIGAGLNEEVARESARPDAPFFEECGVRYNKTGQLDRKIGFVVDIVLGKKCHQRNVGQRNKNANPNMMSLQV